MGSLPTPVFKLNNKRITYCLHWATLVAYLAFPPENTFLTIQLGSLSPDHLLELSSVFKTINIFKKKE